MTKGVYYYWLSRRYPWGDIGRSISQWVYVGLNSRVCPEGDKAFAVRCTYFQKEPWGYTCRTSTNFKLKKGIPVDDHLKAVKLAIDEQAELYELATHLRPLEQAGYWSEDLHQLLETYLEMEELVFQDGLKRKCEWLLTYIGKHDIQLSKEGVKFRAQSYARGKDIRVSVTVPETISKQTDWFLKRISVKPKSKGKGNRIQKKDVVLYYPVFKEVISNIDSIVNKLDISQEILDRWGYL